MATDNNTVKSDVLILALIQGNEGKVRTLINAGADVNIIYSNGQTALFYAVQRSNNESVVRALIDAGAGVNISDKYGQTALLYAVQQSNNESVVRALIDARADVNMTDIYKQTPIFFAAQKRNKSMVCALIDAGAHVNITDDAVQTPLCLAAKVSNNESVIRALIDAGSDVNITDENSQTSLFYAVQQSNNESVVRALIDAGAGVNMTNTFSKSALFDAVHQSNENAIHVLIDAGADVNITDDIHQTALFYAVRECKNESLVQTLIDAGADVNIMDALHGHTALFYAVRECKNESLVQTLIDAGADVNIMDALHGHTALFYAVHRSSFNEGVVRALINAGVDVNIKDFAGRTALFCAVLQNNNESMIPALIDAGADVNINDFGGRTALFYAVQQNNNESMIHALIDAGADVNMNDFAGRTALFYAVQQNNNESMIHALIDSGADVNKTDKNVQTALFYAVQQSNNESIVRALIDAGADVNITDKNVQTAFFYAVRQSNNESVVHALIEASAAFVNVRDVNGRTALFYALDYPRSARFLVENGRKYLFRLRDNFNCSILDFFVDCRLFHNGDDGSEGDDYSKESLSQIFFLGFFDLLEECEVQKVIFAEAIFNMAFCKFPLIFLERQSLQTHITRALELASQFINNQKEMERLIVLINEKCKNGEGLSEALELLVKLGADPNSIDSDGNTALHYASRLAMLGVPQEFVMEICLQMEKHGVQLNLRNNDNETPLLFCLSSTAKPPFNSESIHLSAVKTLVEVCRFLLKHGSSFEERPRSRKTLLHLILRLFQEGLFLSVEKVRQDVLHEAIKLLQLFSPKKVAETGMVNIRDADLNSPLHQWASLGMSYPRKDYTSNVTRDLTFEEFLQTILKYLGDCGVVMNDRNRYGQTPLHFCSTWIAVKLLLDAGASANDVDSSGASPLLAAAKRLSLSGYHRGFGFDFHIYPDVSDFEDPKSFLKTAIDKGLDPWTADKEGESVLSILIRLEDFVLAGALVNVACEKGHTQFEPFAVALLNAICKDKSTRTNWKANLVQDILKSRKGPTTSCEPLRHCCRTVIKTGILHKGAKRNSTLPRFFHLLPVIKEEEEEKEEDEVEEEHRPTSEKRRMDTSDHAIEVELENSSVHCEIIKMLRVYGADGESCMDIAGTCDALKKLLTNPLDDSMVSVLIPWTSISKKYEVKLAKVARRQECDVIHEEFWCHKEHIGSGSFGHVFVGINDKDGREVAIKRIEKVRMQRPEDKREITNLTALADCEQVVRYLNFFEDDRFAYIVLELMEGNLDEYLTDGSTFDASKSAQLCEDVVKGLKFLHAQHIIHRDLKPGNILFKTHPQLRLKIADFGLSRRVDGTATTVYGTNAGTRCWIAPEVLTATHDHSKASDMFSCGIVLHYILSVQKHPFSPSDCTSKGEYQIAHETEANIMNGSMEGWNRSIQLEATHLVQRMLECDKDKRPSAGKALDHPLFWSNVKKVDFLKAVGNQPVFEYPRSRRLTLTPVEADLEKNISTIIVHGNWNDPMYKYMPPIYAEMTSSKRKSYDIHSVVELVRFIRNAYAHVSEATRPTPIKKMLLEDFVFLEYFPHLVMEVYKVVTDHGWDQTVEEIKYAMNK